MYLPKPFKVDDRAALTAFMARYGFAVLVVPGEDGAPVASHLPLLYHPEGGPAGGAESGPAGGREASTAGTVVGHMARANPQWRRFDGNRKALAIFQGPHAYISPAWYGEHPSVPTWNYAAVHATGTPRVIEDREALWRLLQETVALHEAGREAPWPLDLPEDYRERMIGGIVGFEMPISRLEGKFKLSQNRSPEDRRRVMAALAASGTAEERLLAVFMEQHNTIVFGAEPSPGGTGDAARARLSSQDTEGNAV